MTCVVGLKHNGKVYLGGDSAAICGGTLSIRKNAGPKVFQNGDFMFGYAGSIRLGNLLQYSFNPPEQSKHQDDMAYLVSSFTLELHETLSLFKNISSESTELDNSSILMAYKGNLYILEVDLQIRPVEEFEAIGCGEDIAIGAMAATKDWDDPCARIENALRIASEFNAGVVAPFHILSSEEDS